MAVSTEASSVEEGVAALGGGGTGSGSGGGSDGVVAGGNGRDEGGGSTGSVGGGTSRFSTGAGVDRGGCRLVHALSATTETSNSMRSIISPGP
jgi:hypothetical protein